MKQELQTSIIETADEEDFSEVIERVKNSKEPKDTLFLVEKYEDLLKRENKKIINVVGK